MQGRTTQYKNDVMIALDKQKIYLFEKCMFYVITKVSLFTRYK